MPGPQDLADSSAAGRVDTSHFWVDASLRELSPALLTAARQADYRVSFPANDLPAVPSPVLSFCLIGTAQGVLVWSGNSAGNIALAVSRILACRVHWLDVDPEERRHCYFSAMAGVIEQEAYDPEESWRKPNETFMQGALENMARRWPSDSAFVSWVEQFYRPLDLHWHYGKWIDEAWREETLATTGTPIRHSVCIALSPKGSRVEFLGDWHPAEEAATREALQLG